MVKKYPIMKTTFFGTKKYENLVKNTFTIQILEIWMIEQLKIIIFKNIESTNDTLL